MDGALSQRVGFPIYTIIIGKPLHVVGALEQGRAFLLLKYLNTVTWRCQCMYVDSLSNYQWPWYMYVCICMYVHDHVMMWLETIRQGTVYIYIYILYKLWYIYIYIYIYICVCVCVCVYFRALNRSGWLKSLNRLDTGESVEITFWYLISHPWPWPWPWYIYIYITHKLIALYAKPSYTLVVQTLQSH
jgi:hypothetical protein